MACVGATRLARRTASRIFSCVPRIFDSRPGASSRQALSARISRVSRAVPWMRPSTTSSASGEIGFSRKSAAPSFIARTAVSIAPNAVSTTTGRAGLRWRDARRTSMPSFPGMRRSVITRSKSSDSSAATAAGPSATGRTSYPADDTASARNSRESASSSAMSARCVTRALPRSRRPRSAGRSRTARRLRTRRRDRARRRGPRRACARPRGRGRSRTPCRC